MWEEHGERGWVDSVDEDLRDDFAVNTDLAPPEGTIRTDQPVSVEHVFCAPPSPLEARGYDSDGDLIVPRKRRRTERAITLQQVARTPVAPHPLRSLCRGSRARSGE